MRSFDRIIQTALDADVGVDWLGWRMAQSVILGCLILGCPGCCVLLSAVWHYLLCTMMTFEGSSRARSEDCTVKRRFMMDTVGIE